MAIDRDTNTLSSGEALFFSSVAADLRMLLELESGSDHPSYEDVDGTFREVTGPTTTVTDDDDYISIQHSLTGIHTVTLPAITADNHGKTKHLKDADYNAGGNNINVNTTGGDTLEGQASGVMNSDGQAWSVRANNTTKNWELF